MITRLTLKASEERRLLRGHLWVFRSELKDSANGTDGGLVDLYTSQNKFVGRGFYQAEGGIAVRLLDRHQIEIDGGFLAKRLDDASNLRQRLFPGSTTYRWGHGESDGLAGLVVDRFGPFVTAQSTCTFYAQFGDELIKLFLQAEGVNGARLAVGESVFEGGEVPETCEAELNGLRFRFSTEAGQKTGFFLDQRQNAGIMDYLAKDLRVLDGHCYVGQWSIRAARAGAAEVIGVDTSAPALAQARANAVLNEVGGRIRFEEGSVEDRLQGGERFGLICLDPPALAKNRAALPRAQKRYQSLNRDAMKCLEPGGFLVTSSCSHLLDEGMFLELLKRAARSAQRQAVILERRSAPPDHPVLMSMPETGYLNCAVLRIL